jgi:hypothetical protein
MNTSYPVTNNQSFGFGATGKFLQNIKEGAQYNKTCKTLINCIPTVQGTVYKRSGFLGLTVTEADWNKLQGRGLREDTQYKICVLEPDDTYRYVLIFCAGTLIGYPIYDQWNQANVGNPTFELDIIDTFFDENDIKNMCFNRRKLEVIVYTTNHIEQVVRIERKVGETKWHIAMQPFSYLIMPMLPQNEDRDNTISATQIQVEPTITFNKDTLKPGHVGAQFGFYGAPSNNKLWEADLDVSAVDFVYYGDNVYRQVKVAGKHKTGKNPPIHNAFGEVNTDGEIYWEYLNSGMGYAVLREYVSPKEGRFEVIVTLPPQATEAITGTLAIWRWNESAFSNVRGWASCGVTWSWNDGERIIVSGVNRFRLSDTWTDPVTRGIYERNATLNTLPDDDTEVFSPDEDKTSDTSIYGSRVNDFSNFDVFNATNESAFSYSLSAERECKILWLVSARNLIVGTTAGIFEYEMMTGTKVKSLDYVKDSLSRHVPARFGSNVLYYVSNTENCLKIVTTDVNGENQNSSVSDRAQELTRGIIDLISVETDKNHMMMLRDNGTITGLYFDASEQVNVSGMYQITTNDMLTIKAIDTIYLDTKTDAVHEADTKAQVLVLLMVDISDPNNKKFIVGYINLNQAVEGADAAEPGHSSYYLDQYNIIKDGGQTVVDSRFPYKTKIELHKQGFFNPGHPYGDISQGSVVKYIACNTYNTSRPPTFNGNAPSNRSIVGPTTPEGKPLPGSEVEVVWHYSMNFKNNKPLVIETEDDKALCIINMDITLDVSERS